MRALSATSRWIALLGLLLIIVSAVGMARTEAGLRRETIWLGGTPVTVYRATQDSGPLPAVLIVHGFSASRPIMGPLARTLARSGYLTVSYDMRGHGANRAIFTPSASQGDMDSLRALTDELGVVMAYARGRDDVDVERMAVLGHSLGTAVSTAYALDDAGLRATLALSTIYSDVRPGEPPNLLLLVGALEPGNFRANATLALANYGGGAIGETAGDHAQGTARRLAIVPGVEHMSILFSRFAAQECLDWLAASMDPGQPLPGAPWDRRILWAGILCVGAVMLFSPLAHYLWRRLSRRAEYATDPIAGIGWRPLIAYAIAAIGAPLILRLLPWRFPSTMVADYLGPLLLTYGLLAGAVAWPAIRQRQRFHSSALTTRLVLIVVVYVALLALYLAATAGVSLNLSIFVLTPVAARIPGIVSLVLMALPFFYVQESLARGRSARPAWGYWTAGAVGWALAAIIGLLLGAPFFIVLVLPALVALLAITAYLGSVVYRACRIPLAGAMLQALCVGWVLGLVGPLLGG